MFYLDGIEYGWTGLWIVDSVRESRPARSKDDADE